MSALAQELGKSLMCQPDNDHLAEPYERVLDRLRKTEEEAQP